MQYFIKKGRQKYFQTAFCTKKKNNQRRPVTCRYSRFFNS